MPKIGMVLPLYLDLSNFGDLAAILYRIRRETGATYLAQYLEPTVSRAMVKGYLDAVEMAGMKTMIGFFWKSGIPDRAVYEPFLTDPAIRDHPALDAYSVLDEFNRHGLSPESVVDHMGYANALAPRLDMVIGLSGEAWRFPDSIRAGQFHIGQLSCLEWRIAPDGTHVFQRQDILDNHTASRRLIKGLGVRVQSTLQGWQGETYYAPPLAEFIEAYNLITGPSLSADLSLDKVLIQHWGPRNAAIGAREINFGAPEFEEHRAFLLSLASQPEPEPEPAPPLEYWPGGTVVPADGEYIAVYPKTLKAGATFPKGFWTRQGHIQVLSK